MKVLLLGIDVTRASCDPSLHEELDDWEYSTGGRLDRIAGLIADFTALVRHDCDAVAWTKQDVVTSEDHDPIPLPPEERAFHRVIPFETDEILSKTQMSPYPEHEEYFNSLKGQGIDTVVLTGFDASNCIYWTINSLLENGFKVIVPEELVGDSADVQTIEALEHYMNQIYHGQLVITSSENAAHMILTDEPNRTPPLPTRTWDEINSLLFGFGS